MSGVAIVGGSLAGLRCAQALRSKGYDGTITLHGEEHVAPYDRPPLSKQVLSGEWSADRIPLADDATYEKLSIDLRLGHRVESYDEVADADHVVVATGARARTIDGGLVVRTLADSLALHARLADATRVAVVGAGVIGAEVAAVARSKGLQVTLLEALPQPLSRGLGEEVGAALGALHTAKGVELRTGVGVARIDDEGVHLADDSVVEADVVVVGIGVVPNTEWLQGSGADIAADGGVLCDAALRVVGLPNAWACGDVARWPHPRLGEVRIEHWTNAVEQAQFVAGAIVEGRDTPDPFGSVPFVWSDQYEHRIQIVGRAAPTDEIRAVHGTLAEGPPWVVEHVRDGEVTGVTGVDAPKVVMPYRRSLWA
ncbi:MAG TPA: FAD/NAD(P)-binding oxidoreductase [Acidimicrobiales bacterium]|nr:FAD/NAD(P)-binding oxidoreductase [Acidimicrobiales bacterium]